MKFGHAGLVIEQVELGRSTRHEQINHAFGAGREMRLAKNGSHGVAAQRAGQVRIQDRAQRGHANAGGRPAKEMPPGHQQSLLGNWIHSRGQFLVTVSSRFKIVLASVPQAANSIGSTSDGLNSPTASNFSAADLSWRYSACCSS